MLHACPRPVEAYSNSLPRDACSRAAEPCMQMREEPGRKASRSEALGASQTRDRQISCASTRRPGGRVGTGCALHPGCTEFCSIISSVVCLACSNFVTFLRHCWCVQPEQPMQSIDRSSATMMFVAPTSKIIYCFGFARYSICLKIIIHSVVLKSIFC